MSEMNRRDFVAMGAAAACACLLGCGATRTLAAPAGEAKAVQVGALADFSRDGVYMKWARSHGFVVVRADGRLYALESECSHKGATVREDAAAGDLRCPSHGSRFSFAGEPTKGPADQPLERLGITLVDGQVEVDRARKFGKDGWADAAASVKIAQ